MHKCKFDVMHTLSSSRHIHIHKGDSLSEQWIYSCGYLKAEEVKMYIPYSGKYWW